MNTFPFSPLLVLFYSLNKYAQSMRMNKEKYFSLLKTDSLCFPSLSFTALHDCPETVNNHSNQECSAQSLSWHMVTAVMKCTIETWEALQA